MHGFTNISILPEISIIYKRVLYDPNSRINLNIICPSFISQEYVVIVKTFSYIEAIFL